MSSRFLRDLDELESLEQPPLLLVDTRLLAHYRRGHLPGAAHLDTFDYTNERTDGPGLEQVQSDWAAMFAQAGITGQGSVVFYDQGTENRAPRNAFMLRYLGHPRSYILHGGVNGWVQAGRELETAPHAREPLAEPGFQVQVQPGLIATADQVAAVLDAPGVRVFDVRTHQEWNVLSNRHDNPRLGRLPGAAHIPWWDLYVEKTWMRPEAELRRELEAQGVTPDKEIYVSCQRSHRASNVNALLERLGYPRRRVYIGSFFEWSRRPEFPIEEARG